MHIYVRRSVFVPYPKITEPTSPIKKLRNMFRHKEKAPEMESARVTIARGTRAVFGALADDTSDVDGGQTEVKKVMTSWGLRPGLNMNYRG